MIAILYALDDEVAGLHQLIIGASSVDHPWAPIIKGSINNREVFLVKSGASKVYSSVTAQSIIEKYSPSGLILCGVSGALNPTYKRGDLVVGTEFIQHDIDATKLGFLLGQIPFTDYRSVRPHQRDLSSFAEFTLPENSVHFGSVISGDQFIDGDAGQRLREVLQADVVDMESAAIALTCSLNRIPFIVARTISDSANEDAGVDFTSFLPVASRHVTSFVQYALTHCFQ